MASTTSTDDASSPLSYPASKTALILLDFQNFVVARVGEGASDAVANAKKLQDWAFTNGILIIQSIVDPELQPPTNTKGHARLASYVAELDSHTAAIIDELLPASGTHEYVFKKRAGIVSGLKAEGAMDLLRQNGIESLLLCGFSTSGAVLRTAVPATDDGFVVTVVRDACADPKQAVHEMLMEEVLGSRAFVEMTEDVVREFCKA